MGEATVGQDARSVALRAAWICAGIALLTALTFAAFPGHTYLQSDTQIYLPILERLRDPSVLSRDIVAERPHVSFTIYDEVALALRRMGMDFESALALEQFIFRALGIFGIWLAAAAMGLKDRMAMLVAAALSLGATIAGPTVLAVEYEPVPRGFAVPLLLLAMGLAARGRDILAGTAASLAFLYHPPSVATFWAVYFVLTLLPSKPQVMSRRILGLAPLLAGVVVMLTLSRMQPHVSELQPFFGSIDPELERIQRLRASYNWVSTWAGALMPQYVFLWVASIVAYRRIRKDIPQDLRFFVLGLPLLGILTVPASYLLLERMKWVVAPQLQPARALVFVAIIAAMLAAAAGISAALWRRWWECALWFVLVYAIPIEGRLFGLPQPPRRIVLAVALAGVATIAAWSDARRFRWAPAAWAAAVLLPFLLIPSWGRVHNYAQVRTPELTELARWARTSTARDTVFLFPDTGRGIEPGVFRAEALRAIYVDWKGGGQVNFLRSFAHEWWERWQRTGAGRFKPWHVPAYARWGIDYFVLKPAHRLPDRVPIYENARYLVYATHTENTTSE